MENSYSIRPAGRHIFTIGKDLIQDRYAAVVELVKNAYDADSADVVISFIGNRHEEYTIIVEDHGHGMSRDTVINRWMVPSTNDKLTRKKSPNGRVMQGKKGIGRYAASILGKDLLLETTKDGETTTLFIDWKAFEDAEYLHEVEILIETKKTDFTNGTKLTISDSADDKVNWLKKDYKNTTPIDKLKYELSKLIPPFEFQDTSSFSIEVVYKDLSSENVRKEKILPIPVFDLYDYKISGIINSDGTGVLEYSQQNARNIISTPLPYDLLGKTNCGRLELDIRVYDRDKDAIDALIARGLKNNEGNYLGKLDARKLLDAYSGIGVYRNGFRIRPLGDPDFDWLTLNAERVQNPSFKIGSNQVIGYVKIQSEEYSNLIEKSARDGLKENISYSYLVKITKEVICLLESRRYSYRRKLGLGNSSLKIEQNLEKLFYYDDVKKNIADKLAKKGISENDSKDIMEILSRDEYEKNKIADNLRQAVAIYQGQATLGKIVNVILHEGRRPLSYFKNQSPVLKFLLKKTNEIETQKKIEDIADGFNKNTDILSNLFSRVDPLATGRRGDRKKINIKRELSTSLDIFKEIIEKKNINISLEIDNDLILDGWSQDFQAIFANLIDNSLYWMIEKNSEEKTISVRVNVEEGVLSYIDYQDTGPGIDSHILESGALFEPQFSMKPNGTGIGLAIAGEAATRNNLKLEALESTNGAYFRLQPIER
ncbi:sensor histidine kinase [Hafnia paralvei]|uniref:sensor histidine kinase n=1 Tax=Hafnia paralvei TaxID=546367 RepID=UPI0024BBAC95|nr:sensor histidine kinase [Hafnia paralvei]